MLSTPSLTTGDSLHPPLPEQSQVQGRRVVLCTNFLAPYRLEPMRVLTESLKSFTILASTKMEDNRQWEPDWSGLNVILQRSFSFKQTERHPSGFAESTTIHLPYDTPFQLRRLRPDVVISMEMGVRSILSALYCAFVPSCRLVIWADVSEVSEQGRGAVRLWLRRWLLRRTSAVIANGASGRRYVEALGVSSERIHVIPYTTDVDLFLSYPDHRKSSLRRRLLFVGQLIPRKGILPFLKICVKWCDQHPDRTIEVILVGHGNLKGSLEFDELPPNMIIRVEKPVDYQQMPSIYQDADLLVLPTLADTWALVVNEAMLTGLPVLGSVYSQAVDEMVVEGSNGWRFRSDDPEDSYRALCRVMTCSDEQLRTMGRCAKETAAAIGPELIASRVVEVVENVCRSRGAILTNIVSPYRSPIYNLIGRVFDLTVFTSKQESNRRLWLTPNENLRTFSVRQVAGFLFTRRKRSNGQVFDFKYLHVPFGVLPELIGLRPDWIISTEMGVRTLMALLYASMSGIPLWVWWGGTNVTERQRGFLRKTVRKFFVRHVKHWISYGLSSTEYLVGIGVDSSTIVTIQNCAAPPSSTQPRTSAREYSKKPRFLCVGQLIGRKGIAELMHGLASLQEEGLRGSLTLLGSGPEMSSLQRLATELKLDEVDFAGGVRAQDVYRRYGEADFVVFPTMEDVWGLVVNEAIQAGVPVLCSIYAGCVNELVPVDYRFDPADPESIKRALRSAFRGEVKPIPKSVLRSPESVAQEIIADIAAAIANRHSLSMGDTVPA